MTLERGSAIPKAALGSALVALAACGGLNGTSGTSGATGVSDAGPTAAATQASVPTASPIPSASAAATADASTGIATYEGCSVFPSGSYYSSSIASAPVDARSALYISSMVSAGNTSGFYASAGVEKINVATDEVPMVVVKPRVSYHPFPQKYPWSPSFFIEQLSDAHAIVVQTQDCKLYETYGTAYRDGVLSAYSGATWNLSGAFVPLAPGTPSAMASGLSLFAGMVRWEDYESGSIRHALNWAPPAHTVAQWLFVAPASDTDQLPFYGTGLQLPYGARLRLKASFSTAGWGPQATAVANAMKTYGIYLADTGSGGNAIYFADEIDGNPWNSDDLAALNAIRISDFDVLALPSIQSVPGH